ncbi:MAG: hypothetical protein JXR03_13425 [Cyclobacteriaceae bacterium]
MKKIYFILLALLLSKETVFAQDDGGEIQGPEVSDLLIEITGSPFTGTSLLDFGQFRARYFVSEAIVPRLGIYIDFDNSQSTPDVVTNDNTYTLMPGVEYHFQRDGKFRSYAAFDFIISSKTASRESSTGPSMDGTTQLPNFGTSSINNFSFSTGSRGYFQYGVGLSTGADYHFNSRFYIGTEIGFQYNRRIYSDIEVDGELFQEGTDSNFANVIFSNSFRVGFKLF